MTKIEGDVLVWIDLEMDGLDINSHTILEIACIVTNFHLTQTREGPDLVIHHRQSRLEAMGQWCMKHHTESGLVDQVSQSELSMEKAERLILDFLDGVTQNNARLFLAGNSVYVDRYFLEKDMPRLNARLDQTILDCSALNELLRRFNYQIYQFTPIKGGNLHRALDDTRNSIEEFRYYQMNAFDENASAEKNRPWPQSREISRDLLWMEIDPKINCVLIDGHLHIIDRITGAETAAQVIRFLKKNRISHDRIVPIAGRCLGPLRAQLKQIAPELNEFCHYRSVDIDVVSLICEKWFPQIFADRPIRTENDDSLLYSIELLRYYRSTIFKINN